MYHSRTKIQQFHHIPVECETATVALCMLEMPFGVVLRMADGEDAICHRTGITSTSHHIMTSMTLRHSLDGLLDLYVIFSSTARAIPNQLLNIAKLHTRSCVKNTLIVAFDAEDNQ